MIRRIKVEAGLLAEVNAYLATHNLANRGVEDGDKNKQMVGLTGELVVIEYLTEIKYDLSLKTAGFDGGYDLVFKGYKIDVKTMERRSYVRSAFVNNFYIMQQRHHADIVVFCSYHTPDNVVEICGWILKSELSSRGIYYAAGTKRLRSDGSAFTFRQANYEVENKDLNDIESLKRIGII